MDSEEIFIDTDKLTFAEDEIDSGNYGHVFTVKDKKTGQTYAAKELEATSYLTPKSQQSLIREVVILKKIHHPAIIEFKGFSFISFQDQSQWQPTIFTGFVENKTLYTIMNEANRGLSPPEWTLTKQYITLLGIASAMKYLHFNKILHRDLKPGNILLDKNFYPKLCDFGFSRRFKETMLKSQVGTQTYMAPEILLGNPYGPPVDVYSFGIMACEIMSKSQAYPGIEVMDMKIMKKIANGTLRPTIPSTINSNMKNLIEKCWDSEPNNRPTFEEIFSELSQKVDTYIENVDKKEIDSYINLLNEHQKKNGQQIDHLRIQNINQQKNDSEKVQLLEKKLCDEQKRYGQEIENLKIQNENLIEKYEKEKKQLQESITSLKNQINLLKSENRNSFKLYEREKQHLHESIGSLKEKLSEEQKEYDHEVQHLKERSNGNIKKVDNEQRKDSQAELENVDQLEIPVSTDENENNKIHLKY
ncbi:hypothetical protein M9Y10_007149 [Tritrichomonas musculus]|uniref:Protein kinase domain-containing protein n=1 Tax=Tritrichomonas musculus TaxID=1915356 RepID=A0ABR2J1I6_9EUKA